MIRLSILDKKAAILCCSAKYGDTIISISLNAGYFKFQLSDVIPWEFIWKTCVISLRLKRYEIHFESTTSVIGESTVYAGLTIVETLLLWAAGMSLFDAVNHAFSTVATGGFSTKNTSIMHFDSVTIDLIITVFMALSAMHFGIIFAVMARRSLKPLKQFT